MAHDNKTSQLRWLVKIRLIFRALLIVAINNIKQAFELLWTTIIKAPNISRFLLSSSLDNLLHDNQGKSNPILSRNINTIQ